MSSDREAVGKWYSKDLLGYTGRLPSPSFGLFFGKCLMDVVAADGVISAEERAWIIGFTIISGHPDDVIKQLELYYPEQKKEGIKILQSQRDADYIKLCRLSLIYNAFRAAGADGEIHEKEAEAISALGKEFGATDEQIRNVRLLYNDDVALRKKRAATLVPQRLDTVLNELKKAD